MKRNKSFKITSVLSGFLCLFLSSTAQVINSAQIDTLVEKTLKAFDVPGIAVAVIKDGKIIHAKGYGVRSLRTNQKVDENTLFGIASNSKAFTAAALGMLVEEKKITWDDKVIDHIPEFRMYDPYVTDAFTIRDLLTHRSGLGLGAGDLMFFPDGSDFTLKDIIHNIRFLKQESSFRTKFDYDNNLYIVAGEVVKRVSGLSWEDFIEQKILHPLGMKTTAASFFRLKDTSNVIDAHAPVDGKVQPIDREWADVANAAGGIYSNVTELSKWAIMQMDSGRYDGNKKLFSVATHEEMWSPQTIIQTSGPSAYNTHFAAYGLGWFLADAKGYKQVSHTGGLAGIVTQVTLIPELKLGIIVLTNQQSGAAFTAITNTIKDSYFQMPYRDRVKQYSDNVKNQEKQVKIMTDKIWKEIDSTVKSSKGNFKIDHLIGTYTDAWLGDVIISIKNQKPWFQSVRSPKLTGEMLPYKGNTYVIKWVNRSMDADAFASFELDSDGKGAGIKMKAISPLTDFSYDFHHLNFIKKP